MAQLNYVTKKVSSILKFIRSSQAAVDMEDLEVITSDGECWQCGSRGSSNFCKSG